VMTVWDPDGPATLSNPELVLGGSFNKIFRTGLANTAACNIVAYAGVEWDSFGSGGFNAPIRAFTTWDRDGGGPVEPVTVAVGDFDSHPGGFSRMVAAYNGSTWSSLNSALVSGSVNGVAAFVPGFTGNGPQQLVIGGSFIGTAFSTFNNVAVFNGTSW